MARKNYNVDEVISKLSKKRDCKLFPEIKVIEVHRSHVHNNKGELVDNSNFKGDLGNGSWGKIDFLTKYNGWVIIRVKSHSKN